MRKVSIILLTFVLSSPAILYGQRGGAFVGSLGMGITSAQDDFADAGIGFSGGGGFGMEAELRYCLWGGFSVGGFVNYMRFGSSYPTTAGRVSFNFSQMGGLGKMNFIRLHNGAIYLTGGGGVFTPSAHFYVPENSTDRVGAEQGYFGFGGIGLISYTDRRVLYELEARYNIARADYTLESLTSNVWDFIYVGVKVSWASKGNPSPPRF